MDGDDGETESVVCSLVTGVRNGGGVDEAVYGLYRFCTLEVEFDWVYGGCGGWNGKLTEPPSLAIDRSASLMP